VLTPAPHGRPFAGNARGSGGDLRGLGLDAAPSQTNFLLLSVASHGNKHDARHVYAKLIERNIYVRWFDTDGLRDKLRITIGTPEENVAVVAALRQITGQRGTE
jgi:histidinol-phosphate aminotransferase